MAVESELPEICLGKVLLERVEVKSISSAVSSLVERSTAREAIDELSG